MTPRRLNLPNERERLRAIARWHTVQRNILCWRSTAICVVQPAHIPKFKDGQAETGFDRECARPPQVLNLPGATTDIKPTPDASPMDGGSKTAPTQIETPVPITDVKPAPGAAPTTSTAPAATLSTTDDKPAQLPGSKGQPLPPFTSAPTKSSPPPGSAPAASSTDTPNIEPESALPGSNGQPLPVTTPASDVPPHVAKPTSPPRRASAPAPPPEAELPPPAAAPPPPPEAEPTTPPESGDAASPASSDEK
jgi:hypothetical protein